MWRLEISSGFPVSFFTAGENLEDGEVEKHLALAMDAAEGVGAALRQFDAGAAVELQMVAHWLVAMTSKAIKSTAMNGTRMPKTASFLAFLQLLFEEEGVLIFGKLSGCGGVAMKKCGQGTVLQDGRCQGRGWCLG
jgi:hypothetical protein